MNSVESFLDEGSPRSVGLLVGGILLVLGNGDLVHVLEVDGVIGLDLPDLAVAHDIDDFELLGEVVDEELDGFHSEVVLQLLHVLRLVHHLHDVLGAFLVVDAEDAGLGEADRQLLHDVVAGLHDLGAGERLDFQEGVP